MSNFYLIIEMETRQPTLLELIRMDPLKTLMQNRAI